MASTKTGKTLFEEIAVLANLAAEERDTDVLLFNSQFGATTDRAIVRRVTSRRRRKNVTLILVSEGGNADAAYKIARCLQSQYERFTAYIHGYCKSAGTLCVLGANEVVMSDIAELGPLDVQIAQRDELGERSSGLVAAEALRALQKEAFLMFEDYFLQIKRRSANLVTFRTASDIALRLTVGLFEPLYAQINPIQVGDTARSMRVAADYGKRLDAHSKNLSDSALELLCETYPSHGFVIDRDEASSLFKTVRVPSDSELALATKLGELAYSPIDKGFIQFLNDEIPGGSNEVTKAVAEVPGRKGLAKKRVERRDAGDSAGTARKAAPRKRGPSESGPSTTRA